MMTSSLKMHYLAEIENKTDENETIPPVDTHAIFVQTNRKVCISGGKACLAIINKQPPDGIIW